MAIAPFLSLPSVPHYWLANARLPLALLDTTVTHRQPIAALASPPFAEELVAADVAIDQGRITAIAPVGTAPAHLPQVDLAQGLVLPCFVDSHTHLDKGQIWNRAPNPDGTFQNALAAVKADAVNWHHDDLYRRMEFGLRCSYAHGTKAIRTHFDAFGEMADVAITVIRQLQQAWAGQMILQPVCLVSLDYYLTPAGDRLADQVAAMGGILGGVAYPNPALAAQVDRVLELAAARSLAVDLHVDETLDPTSMSLRTVAQAKIRHGFSAPVVCGHCCSLSTQDEATASLTLQWVKDADIGIISLPMCNLYLQDRHPQRMPRYRGVTLLHELRQRQIPVALASDNCRDPFYAYGDHDGIEVFTQAVRIGHLDRPIADWIKTVTWTAADLLGIGDAGRLGVGQPADLVLLSARTFSELLCRPQSDRVVVRQGQAIDTTLPAYAELDDLCLIS